MAESPGIVAVVPMTEVAFRRYCDAPRALIFARRLHEALSDQSGAFLLRYVKAHGALLYADIQQRARSAFEGELVAALLESAEAARGRGVVLVSAHLPTLEEDGPERCFLLQPGATPEAVVADELGEELAFAYRLLREEFWADESLFEFAAAHRKANVVPVPIRRAYAESVKLEQRALLRAALAAATRERPVKIFDFCWFDGSRCYETLDRVLEGANPYELRQVSRGLSADDRFVWCRGKRVEGADGPSLKVIGGVDSAYAVDSRAVYYDGRGSLHVLSSADPAKFRVKGCFGYDESRAFCFGGLLDAEPPFRVLDPYNFLVAKNAVFHENKRLSFDPETFAVVASHDSTNPFLGPFTVRDKHGEQRYVRVKER